MRVGAQAIMEVPLPPQTVTAAVGSGSRFLQHLLFSMANRKLGSSDSPSSSPASGSSLSLLPHQGWAFSRLVYWAHWGALRDTLRGCTPSLCL